MQTIIALTLRRTSAVRPDTVLSDEHNGPLIEKYETFIRIRIPYARVPDDLRQNELAAVGKRKTNGVRREGRLEVRAALTREERSLLSGQIYRSLNGGLCRCNGGGERRTPERPVRYGRTPQEVGDADDDRRNGEYH